MRISTFAEIGGECYIRCMRTLALLILALLAATASFPAFAAEDDAVAAVFVYGRYGGRTATGFAVGDGSFVVTASDAIMELTGAGKSPRTAAPVVVSRWTGDAYPAKVLATDDKTKLALLKLSTPAVQPVAVAKDDALSRVRVATLGELVSGEEVGAKFPLELYAFQVKGKPGGFTIARWRATNACLTEVRGQNYLFLSKVDPPEKAPKAALVVKPGVGALGVYQNRLVVTGGRKPAIFYRVIPASDVRKFLVKSGVPADTISNPASIGTKASDADSTFQVMCQALLASIHSSATAVESATAATKLRPQNAVAHILLGTALARQGKYDDAVKSIDTALEIDPSIPDGHLNRGTALAGAGKSAEAEKDLRQAMQSDPKDPRPVSALAALLTAKDETLPEAVKLARAAALLAPDDPASRVFLAKLLKQSKDYDGAIAELRAVLNRAPKWGEVRVALGATYEAAGKPDLAEAEYRKLVENEPNSPDAHLTLIDFLVSAGKKDEARSAIEAVRKLKLGPEAQESVKKLESRL